MSRFSTQTNSIKTVNHEGGEAFKMGAAMELYSLVCTSLLYPKFYESDYKQLSRLKKLIAKVPHEFTAKLAVYAREKMNLRTVPMVMVVELAKIHSGDALISKLVERVVQRADELTEILAYYVKANDREGVKKLGKLSNQIKKGLANAFGKFNEYQFAKYNRKADVTLKDVLFLTHPKPVNEGQKELFDKIINDNLEVPYTWETQLSKAGQSDSPVTTKKAVWEELIDSRKVGYMALLRNLRNILQADVSKAHIDKVCEYLSNENAVHKSRQLPFRFLSAYRILSGENPTYSRWGETPTNGEVITSPYVGQVLSALNEAIMHSAANIPMFKDETCLMASDVSASMWQPVSERSVIQMYDIGLLMSMMAYSRCESVTTGIFGDKFKTVTLPKGNILPNMTKLYQMEGKVGYSTEGWKVLDWAINKKKSYDRIMMFTDCQMYGGSINRLWAKYRKDINPNAKLYIFDLSGYGDTPINIKDSNVYLLAGWSDKVFDIMANIENGVQAIETVMQTDL